MNRLKIYGMMMLGAMLWLTSCTSEDATKEVAPQEAIAISFGCNYDDEEEDITKNTTRAGYEGAMNTEDLYATGFGVMASVTAGDEAPYDNKPNLMYNQEVSFTFVGDLEELLDPDDSELGVKRGYWSYQPVKYWPTDLTHCYISAYAPYVEPADLKDLPADATGIVGISTNNEAPYITYRRCDNPENVVDLLWYYEEPGSIPAEGKMNMKMRHALARLAINVKVESLPANTKVLVDSITLIGTMTKTAKLVLNDETVDGDNHYPVWCALDPPDTEDRTIVIDNEDNNPVSYGIIDSQIRYIPGMPYVWQPAGLSTTAQNALSMGDRQGYIYLIPVGALELTVKVKYYKWMSGDANPTEGTKVFASTTLVSSLKGNTPYVLNITLSDI